MRAVNGEQGAPQQTVTDVSNQMPSGSRWEMSFQKSGTVMKPTKVIKMQDGLRRPPRDSSLDDRGTAVLYILLSEQQRLPHKSWRPFRDEVKGAQQGQQD